MTTLNAYCKLQPDQYDEPKLTFVTNDTGQLVIEFHHTRPDGPALESKLRQTLCQLLPLHPNLLTPDCMLSFTGNVILTSTEKHTLKFTWDNKFSYSLNLTHNASDLKPADTVQEHLRNACRYAMPDMGSADIKMVCAKDDIKSPITAAKCNACNQFKSRHIEFPITITDIETRPCSPEPLGHKQGALVAIRPADENKTYLGIYLGDLPLFINTAYQRKTGQLSVTPVKNPAIFVFALNKVIYGMESWWHEIASPDDLTDITDDTINNQFYMQYFKQMQTGTT